MTSGHAAAAPPSTVMNSRRLMGCPSGSIGGSRVTRQETSFEVRQVETTHGLEHTKQSRERGPDYHSGDEDHRGKRAKIFKASWRRAAAPSRSGYLAQLRLCESSDPSLCCRSRLGCRSLVSMT